MALLLSLWIKRCYLPAKNAYFWEHDFMFTRMVLQMQFLQLEIEDQVKTFINVEGIEFSSEEEAITYLAETYDLAVPYSSQLKTSCSADLINDELVVSYTTTTNDFNVTDVYTYSNLDCNSKRKR